MTSGPPQKILLPQALEGTWRVLSLEASFDGGPPEQFLGSKPSGYIAFFPSGRMFVMITGEGRKAAKTDEDRAKLLETMAAYTGKYRVEDNKVVIKVDASWTEIWTGTEQTRIVTINGDRMHIETPAIPSGLRPGKMVKVVAEFEREK
jgi:Lipocalin-like domain